MQRVGGATLVERYAHRGGHRPLVVTTGQEVLIWAGITLGWFLLAAAAGMYWAGSGGAGAGSAPAGIAFGVLLGITLLTSARVCVLADRWLGQVEQPSRTVRVLSRASDFGDRLAADLRGGWGA